MNRIRTTAHSRSVTGLILAVASIAMPGCEPGMLDALQSGDLTGPSPSHPAFEKPVSYPVGRSQKSLQLADLNGDGLSDMLVADSDSDTVGVLLNLGEAGFDRARYTELQDTWIRTALGDVDGDRDLDLVIVSERRGVLLLLNHGDGSFDEPSYLASGDFPNAVMLADLDRDGDLDLVAVNFSEDDVTASLNDGAGHFGSPCYYDALGNSSFDGAVGDIDGDGYLDTLVTTKGMAGGSILRNVGDGTFEAPVAFGGEVEQLFDVVPADIDADGDVDLVVQGGKGVFVLRDEGGGTFAPAVQVHDTWSSLVLAADVTGDGTLDLVLGSDRAILINHGDGTFGLPMPVGVAFQPESIAVGDVNGDGLMDLAGVADGEATVLLGSDR